MDNEFVFREVAGKELEFVGNFDGLYKADPDPWGQSATSESGPLSRYYIHSRARLLSALRKFNTPRQMCGLEVGCGHGHVTALLRASYPEGFWWGMDISSEAIAKAQQLYADPRANPHYQFVVEDITRLTGNSAAFAYQMDVVVMNQLLWYILKDFQVAVSHAHHFLRHRGLLVFSQAFLREQRYGRDIVDGFNGLVGKFVNDKCFQIVYAQYDDTEQYPHHDGVLVLRKL